MTMNMKTLTRASLAALAMLALAGCSTINRTIDNLSGQIDLTEQWELLRDRIDEIQAEEPTTPEPATPGTWPVACARIEAAMVTPMAVYADIAQVRSQCAVLKAAGFNSVATLVDLQSGRDYIVPGRNAVMLAAGALENIKAILGAGMTPVIGIRNDWAVRFETGSVPSIGGQPADVLDFYSASMLASEKVFLDSIKDLWPWIHIQLSIEPEVAAATGFALELAKHLRAAGFANRLLVNPSGDALEECLARAFDFAQVKCELARSWHEGSASPDGIWNTDGRPGLNAGNVQSVLAALRASGKEYVLWTEQLANARDGIPAAYFGTAPPATTPDTVTPPATVDPVVVGDNTFLWKPVSESRQGRCAVITPANLNVAKVLVNGTNHTKEYAGRANGERQHWFQDATGAAYGNGVKVQALDAAGKVLRTWTVPAGGARWGSQ